MEFDLSGRDAELAYKLLSTLVTPRPIALVSSRSRAGVLNAAPFSFFNILGSKPPVIAVSPGDRPDGRPKDTAKNISETREFVVNLVDEPLAEAMNKCSATLEPDEDELALAGLKPVRSVAIQCPGIAEAPVRIECRLHDTLRIGRNRIVLGLVLRLHVREGLLDSEDFHLVEDAYRPIGRMHGTDGYCRTRDQFRMKRPDR